MTTRVPKARETACPFMDFFSSQRKLFTAFKIYVHISPPYALFFYALIYP